MENIARLDFDDYLIHSIHFKLTSISAISMIQSFVTLLYNSGFINDEDYFFHMGVLDEYIDVFPDVLHYGI